MYDPLDKRVTDALLAWRTQLDAGISSHEALGHCAALCRGELGRFFEEAAARTAKGDGIRGVLEPLAPVLSEGERAIVAAGWNAGRVEEVLDQVIKQRETWRITRGQILSRSAYPLFTLFVAAFIAPLPGYFIGQYSLPIYCLLAAAPLVFFGGLIFAGYTLFRMRATAKVNDASGNPLPAHPVDRFLLNVPLLSYVERQSALAEFGLLLGSLLQAGTPIVEALAICARALSNGCYRESLGRVQNAAAKGESFTHTLKTEPEKLWPHDFISQVGVGEKSGNLDAALLRAGAAARAAYLRLIEQLAEILPRVIYVLVGLYMAVNILNIFLNVYMKPFNDLMKDLPFIAS
jgi:type II secretory pathway component PulF